MSDKFLFIAIPRTGSMSVVEALKPHGLHAVKYDVGKVDTVFDPERPLTTFYHADVRSLVHSGTIDRKWVESRTMFAVMRNPWERLVSLHRYLFTTLSRHPIRTFAEFVVDVTLGEVESIGPYNWCGLSQTRPQSEWIARAGHYGEVKLHPFEHLSQPAWGAIQSDLGIVADNPLPHIGQTAHGKYQEWYTPTMRDIVADFYARDIELGGYTFD